MNSDKVQFRIGLLILSLTLLGMVIFFVDRTVLRHEALHELVKEPSLWVLLFSLGFFGFATFSKTKWGKAFLAVGTFCTSGPLIFFNGSDNYFGLGCAIIGLIMIHRFGLLVRWFNLKVTLLLVWLVAWVLFTDQWSKHYTIAISLATIAFVLTNLAMLYFLFEEEIRDLLAANRTKDDVLAQQAAEIARLEPLSVLGERVAHVAHSFKNNLNQISTALFLLEQVNDPVRAAAKMREFSQTLNERIENILMVSRAGVDLEPELFDAARVLEGMKQVYLQEKSFVEKCRTVLTVEGPVLVHAVRWDFILMVENILKNALEAISACDYYGTIRIDLARGQLTIANDGGPIPLCVDCRDDCLRCPRYGKPGQTTKRGGSGHGLAQVFATCRANGWGLKLRAQENWTLFEIRFPGRIATGS